MQNDPRNVWTSWQSDLDASRDEDEGQRTRIAFVVRWYLGWAERRGDLPGRESARNFWSDLVLSKSREAWLAELVSGSKVSFSTQKQALNALVFFYRDVCGREQLSLGVKFRRRGRRVPVVLSRREVRAVLDELSGSYRVAAELMYGSGLRLKELLGLRVKDLDFDRRQLVVRSAKGDDDRITILPASSRDALQDQLRSAPTLPKARRSTE